MNDQYVILVSPRDNEIHIVKNYGFRVILLRKEIQFDEIFNVDVPIEIDLNAEKQVVEKCLQLSKQYNIISIFTMNEYRIPLASLIGKVLNLTFQLPYEASLRCRNKKMARQRLNKEGISKVQYFLVTTEDDIGTKLQGYNFPLIVKPSNDSGSKNVFLCENKLEVLSAIKNIVQSETNIVGQNIDSEILIEEFLDGPEFSIESVTINRQTTIIGITRKIVSPLPQSIEIGHDFPASLSAQDETEIRRLVEKSLDILGVDYAVTHTEVKLTKNGPKIVEVNARPGGDEIPHLVKVVTGIDLKALSFLVTLGKGIDSLSKFSPTVPSASIRFLLASQEGEVYYKEQIQSPSIIEQRWFKKNGEYVKKTENNFDRLGYFIVYGEEQNSSAKIAHSVEKELSLTFKDQLEMR